MNRKADFNSGRSRSDHIPRVSFCGSRVCHRLSVLDGRHLWCFDDHASCRNNRSTEFDGTIRPDVSVNRTTYRSRHADIGSIGALGGSRFEFLGQKYSAYACS